jgi:hypothetical protein
MADAMRRGSGQVIVFFALILPLVLLPIAAYAIDAAVTTSEYARLVEVTALAAEDAAEQIDVEMLRANGEVVLDAAAASRVARSDLATLSSARLDTVSVAGASVEVSASEPLRLPLDFVGRGAVTLHATATARIAPGYDRPSSLLPLPVSSF